MTARKSRQACLPEHPFFYTVDQVATLLALDEKHVKDMLYRIGDDVGVPSPKQLKAVNLAPPDSPIAMWRIDERELRRWLEYRRFKVVLF